MKVLQEIWHFLRDSKDLVSKRFQKIDGMDIDKS